MNGNFRPQNQTGRIGSTALIVKPEFRIVQVAFGQSSLEIVNDGDRLTTYSYEFTAPANHLRARKRGFVSRAREGTPCAVHARRVVFPLTLVDLGQLQQRHAADGGCLRPRRQVYVLRLANAENCNCEESVKALVLVTITVRTRQLVMMPEVCASG